MLPMNPENIVLPRAIIVIVINLRRGFVYSMQGKKLVLKYIGLFPT